MVGELHRPADLGHLELSLSESPDGTLDPVIHIHAVAPPGEHDRVVLATFAASLGAYLSVRARGAPIQYLHRPKADAPGYRLPEFDLRICYEPGDFLQGNGEVNRQLVSRVAEWLDDYRDGRLLDAFAGVGNFSLALARRGFDVLGLEVAPEMVKRARDNALANGLENAQFMVRDLLAPRTLGRQGFGVVVLDPPRSGAQALVHDLAANGTATILYVSCSPPTLARDAAVLAAAGYRLARLSLVDMFPQTSHIEVMALFIRRRA
jgi:23S rRNA (uracil1939-C5)-methyltransferase